MPKKISNFFKKQSFVLCLLSLSLSLLSACRMPANDEALDRQLNTAIDLQTNDMQGNLDMIFPKNDIALESDMLLLINDMQGNLDMTQLSDMNQLSDMQMVDQQAADMAIPICQSFPIGITTAYEAPLAIHSEQTLAQVIRMPLTGVLSALKLPAACADGASMNISIKPVNAEGLPETSAPDLSTTIVGNDILPTILNTTTIIQITPVSVIADQQLAIVFSIANGSSCSISQTPGLDYEGGQGFYTGAVSTNSLWESLCPPLAQGCDLPISFLLTPAGTGMLCMEDMGNTENPCQPSRFPYDLNGASNPIVIGGSAHQELAQVFTAQEDQSLVSVMLPIA